jgi:hypothetical protein
MSKNLVEPERPQTIWRVRFACWKVTRARAHACARAPTCTHALTYTHTQTHVETYLFLFHSNNGFVNSPHCCVARTLLALFGMTEGAENVHAIGSWECELSM